MQIMNAPSHSKYHALYLKVQRRFSHGLSFLSSFSYGKSIDNGSGIRTSDGDSLTPSNNYDLELETGLSAFDFRNRWTTSWIWELPVGQDRRFLNQGGVVDFVLGGWQLGGILTLQDGFPFTVRCGPGNIQNGGGECYPGARTGPRLASPLERAEPDALFQRGRLCQSRPRTGDQFPLGTVKRNSVVGAGITSFDCPSTSSSRRSDIVEFRVEVFNLPNLPIWGQPGSQLGQPATGVITSTRIDSRQIQLGLKFHVLRVQCPSQHSP